MRAAKSMVPIVVSVGLILAVTAILWQFKLSTGEDSYHLIYIYLFPVTLIAALYNGRLAHCHSNTLAPTFSSKNRCIVLRMTIPSNMATFLFSRFW